MVKSKMRRKLQTEENINPAAFKKNTTLLYSIFYINLGYSKWAICFRHMYRQFLVRSLGEHQTSRRTHFPQICASRLFYDI